MNSGCALHVAMNSMTNQKLTHAVRRVNRMSYQMITRRGYDFFEASSTLQKAIRRNDPKLAGYFAIELFESGYGNYVWKRLMTVCAEDIQMWISREIDTLWKHYEHINKGKKKHDKPKGRVFISKAVIIMCEAMKSRDADHITNFIYDRKVDITDEEIEAALDETRKTRHEIPEYALDCHTRRGKAKGKDSNDFIIEEHECLEPKQPTLFDDLVYKTDMNKRID